MTVDYARLLLLLVAALVTTPAPAQVTLHESEPVGVYLARGEGGAFRVVGQPHASMPLATEVVADTSESRSRWASSRRGAKIGAVVGTVVGVALVGAAALVDLNSTDSMIPLTFVAAPVALGVVGTSTLIGG
ncbi:hypothetical protein [Rubrivirga marina]|uniref:Uncharacterized protein n=1 Tax=Rubrivirga marina TaxID=1196024 RepID=A0A271J1I4_9BACT|nr:hypothetical protein [Rubrivirga marina]PAP77220.1 hypothetical protein BSZ37_12645 [Rubrivirga marina]